MPMPSRRHSLLVLPVVAATLLASCSGSTSSPGSSAFPSKGYGYLRIIPSEIDWIQVQRVGGNRVSGLFVQNVGPGHTADRKIHLWTCHLSGVTKGSKLRYYLSGCGGAPVNGGPWTAKVTPKAFLLNPGDRSNPPDVAVVASHSHYLNVVSQTKPSWVAQAQAFAVGTT